MSDVGALNVENTTSLLKGILNKRSIKDRFAKINPFSAPTIGSVSRSADFRRISLLPRRTIWTDYSEALTLVFARPPVKPGSCPTACPCRGTGYMKLWPRQAWALSEFFELRGGIALLGPGQGKTLVSMLLPLLMGWERAVLLVPAGLRDKTLDLDYPLLSRHWNLPQLEGPGSLEVMAYEKLSRDYDDYLLNRKVPDGVVADEMHALRVRGSGRSKKLKRVFDQLPVEFCGMSGSPVHRSLMDYAHLFNFALGDNSPVPLSFMEQQSWAYALDEDLPDYAKPKAGALLDFCRAGETVRDGYRRRVLEAPGIISAPDLSSNITLNVLEIATPKIPKVVVEAFQVLRNFGDMPDGEKCTTKLDQLRHARSLLFAYYLRWVWPGGKKDDEWLKKRRAWRKYVRKMTTRSHGGVWLDTEAQVALAVSKGLVECCEVELNVTGQIIRDNVDVHAEWVEIREDRKIKWGGKKEPPKEIVWLCACGAAPGTQVGSSKPCSKCGSDYMLIALEKWVADADKRKEPGIVWVENIGFLDELRKRGHRCFGAGENEIELEDGLTSVFASYAHTVGKNLQMFHRMLFSNPLQNGKSWEQALGRQHRPGQKHDEVVAEMFLGCRETWWSFERSKMDARYIEGTLGQAQRLNKATIVSTSEAEMLQRFEDGEPLWADTGHAKIDGKLGRVVGVDENGKEIRLDTATPLLTEMRRRAKKGEFTNEELAVMRAAMSSTSEHDDEGDESEESESESDDGDESLAAA